MKAIILPFLLAAALLTAPAVLADGPGRDHDESGKANAAEHRAAANATHHDEDDDDDDRAERNRTSDRANRTAARQDLADNRTRLMESFLTRLHSLRASWLENATKVREDCRADNESEPHCIRDGYQSWRATQRAELKELRAEMRALFDSWHGARRHSD